MATEFDKTFRKVATDLIDIFGVTKGRYTSQSTDTQMDDDTMTACPVANTKNMQMSPPIRYQRMDVDGTIIRKDDAFIIIAAVHWEKKFHKLVPKSTDRVKVSGEEYMVVNDYSPIKSGDQVAAYKIQIRKGHA